MCAIGGAVSLKAVDPWGDAGVADVFYVLFFGHLDGWNAQSVGLKTFKE